MVLPRPSALRASSIARLAHPARYIRSAELQPWQHMQRRTLWLSKSASSPKTSEMPWVMGSLLGTAAGMYFVLTQDTSHGGHDEHGDHHEEVPPVVAEEMAAKAAELKEAPMAAKNMEKQHEADKPGVKPAEEKKEAAKEKSKVATDDDEDVKAKEETEQKEAEQEKKDPDAGTKPSSTDKPDARKEAKSDNEMSGKQQGLSNDDTKHSTKPGKDDTKSKKGEGVVDSAKVKGTVSPNRPGAENKEERGKTEQDKDA